MSNSRADPTSADIPPADELLDIYCRTGRPEDFERVVQRYAALVYGECRRVTRDAHDAEDAAQLAFLALAIELKSGAVIKRPAGWLQRVAKRHALKIVRSRGRRKRREQAALRPEVMPGPFTPDDPAARETMAELIRDAIDALPEKHRLPLVLHYFGGLTLDGIAGEMGLTRTAVGTRLHRARKLLGERLGERDVTFNAGELGAMIGLVVPAAVIAQLSRSIGATAAPSTTSATLVAGVTQMIAAAAARPLATAAAAVLCLGATGAAWVGPARVWSHVRMRIDALEWLDRFFDWRMSPQLHAATVEDAAVTETFYEMTNDRRWNAPALPRTTTLASYRSPDRAVSIKDATPLSGQVFIGTRPLIAPLTAVLRSAPGFALDEPPIAHLALTIDPPIAEIASPPRAAGRSLDLGSRHPSLVINAGDQHAFDTLRVGANASDVGSVVQTGGELVALRLIVGDEGTGSYDLTGGKLAVGSLAIGARPRSRGRVHVGGGELHVINPQTPIEVGARGSGKLLLGTQDAPGLLTTATGADVPLIVRATTSAQGLVQGWGDVQTRGPLINNGRVIADGFDHLRALNLTQASTVINTIDNAPDGTNGWYARRGGRVELPSIAVAPGTDSYTWGESAEDPTLDLVNSLRLTAHEQPTAAALGINLRTIALADPLDVPLPAGVAITGLWEFNTSGFDPTSLDVEVRYDHISASSFLGGEFLVRLIGFEAGAWKIADGESLDVPNHIASGTFDGPLKYLAVGIFWDDPFRASLAPMQFARAMSFDGAITPEPSALLVVGFGGLLLRRRRRV